MEILAGAAAGQAFGLLVKGVNSLVTNTREFKPHLRQIGEKLKSLEQLARQRREVELLAEERDKFKTVWEEGKRLVDQLSKVRKWSFFKFYYNGQLVDLDKSLERQLKILQVLQAGDREAPVSIENSGAVNPDERVLLFNSVGDQVPQPPSNCVGLDGPLGDLRTKLVKGDQVSMLSVTAPGDSGKTALARMFYHDQQVNDKFNNRIFFAKVSINPDLNGLTASLQKFLDQTKDNPALLILDDVWPHTSKTLLEELSVFSEGSVYKVLVTSRIMPEYGSHYPLKPLTTDGAICLLKASSYLGDDQCSVDHEKCLKQIVKYCNRSPLVITKIGKSLISRDDIESWKAKEAELTKDPFTPLKTDGLFDSLKLSLDGLGQDKEKIKECFIDLASFPEDRQIHTGALIDIWAELYGVDDDALSIAKLRQLNQNNLAKLVDRSTEKSRVPGCYSEHIVTQQSKLRKLALYLIRQNSAGEIKRLNIDISGGNSQRYPDVKMPKEIDLLSITTDGEFSFKSGLKDSYPVKAKVLVLNFQTKNCALPKLKKEMSKSLKVLVVTNYGSFVVELHILELVGSLPELKRLRLERIAISSRSLTKKVKVESLEKISLHMCNVGKAFSNESIHFFQALPNLVEINIDYCKDLANLPADLCTLRLLKKLIITNCHKLHALPEKMGDLRTCLEVLRVRSCIGLKRLPDSITCLGKLHLLDLFHCLKIEELPEDTGNIRSLRKINMEHCDKLKELPKSVSQLVQLEEVACDEEIKGQWIELHLPRVKFAQEVIKEKHGLEWLST